MDEALKKYDEIWVFANVIPFRTYRMLCKWKEAAEEKVTIFQTVTDLIDYVEKLVQNRWERHLYTSKGGPAGMDL